MADELSAPLRRRTDRSRKLLTGRPWRLPIARLAVAAIIVVLGGLELRVLLVDDPTGGQPQAVADISSGHNTNTLAASVAAPTTDGKPVSITPDPDEIPVPAGASITAVDPSLPIGDDPTQPQPDAFGVLPALREDTQNGPIPRVSASGETPFTAYARASVTPVTAAGKPLVAIVVTGLGLDQAGTLTAIDKLPGDITLAFAPYGKTLQVTTAAARNAGHELLLQIPLEPFDYPDNDPGPQTLLANQQPRANIEKLYWLMARLGGYVGVVNYMGARFTASGGDFAPVMEELGTRGLGYLDDGTSNRSLAPQLASANKVPFGRADMVLDNDPSRGSILAALAALKAKAISDGSAIGVISALPVSIDTVAEWAKDLDNSGVVLVPASALMQ
ncbi:MAG TPA: divergent polysaccharide deacetylase family protein [Devosiaceae bacterium]|jgi:hypothetical protein